MDQLPAIIVPLKSLGADGINRCGSLRGSAGRRAGFVCWRMPSLQRDHHCCMSISHSIYTEGVCSAGFFVYNV